MHSGRSELETWFIRRGVPHFIEPYVARHDIWTRAVPVLVAAYLAGGLYGLDLASWSAGRNAAAAAGVVVILIVSWSVTNVLRRRPAFSRPHRIGGRALVVTEPLLRVAAFLGAFSGMYFTVVLTTDATYRQEFSQDAAPELRQALAVRLAYRFAAARREAAGYSHAP